MKSSPLAKLTPPRVNRSLKRPRVHEVLRASARRPISWIVGPAGTGKTTAVIDYLSRSRKTVLWYRVDQGDTDVATLFYYLTQLVTQRIRGGDPLPIFGPEYAERRIEFARRFFRDCYRRLPQSTTLVFDDAHCAEQSLFPEVLTVALTELPTTFSCFCLSRTLPFPQLSELQIKGQITTVDHSALDFTLAEAEQLYGLQKVTVALARQAYEITQGWAAGLVLIGEQAKRGKGDRPQALATQESKALLFHHLADKIFTALPADQQTLLLYTSLLPEVSARLANELMGRADCAAQLAAIYRQQLFITRRGNRDPVYGYHDLFRDFLASELPIRLAPRDLIALKRRTARILERYQYIEAAVGLALDTQDWSYACGLLVRNAEMLLNAGRRELLIDSVLRVPENVRSTYAWLAYWMGAAFAVHDDAVAEEWFERAYALFVGDGDMQGASATAARVVLARYYSNRSYSGIQVWIDRALQHADTQLQFDSDDTELLVHTGSFCAISIAGQLGTDKAHELACRMLRKLSSTSAELEVNTRFLASARLIGYAGHDNRSEMLKPAIQAIRPYYNNRELRPGTYALWLTTLGWVMNRYGNPDIGVPFKTGKEALVEAIRIAEREDLSGVLFHALRNLYLVARRDGEPAYLENLMRRLEQLVDQNAPLQVRDFKMLQSFFLSSREHYAAALEAAKAAFMLSLEDKFPKLSGWDIVGACFWLTLQVKGPAAATDFLRPHVDCYTGLPRRILRIGLEVATAFGLKTGDPNRYREALALCLSDICKENWHAVSANVPPLAAELFSEGLRYGIEPEFCKFAIRWRNLSPPAPELAHWPWPIKMFALGSFNLEVEGEPAQFGKKPQKKTLDVLKILIAAGGDAVEQGVMCSWLWPELGLSATKALSMVLTRLRKLLKREDAILLENGKLSLNRRVVWVDADAFELRLAAILSRLRQREVSSAASLGEDLLSLYRGQLFGTDEATVWLTATRERLVTKFLDLVAELATFYERQGNWKDAIRVYERGIEQDTLREEFYRGVIRCYLALGEPASAMSTFRRCRHVLSIMLGIPPTPATQALVENMYAARA